jgi:CubicO group peptidase (beta-lactamase class C family)
MPRHFSGETTLCVKRLILLATFSFAALCHPYADGVDDYVKHQMRRQHVVGLSLAVVKDGRLIKARGYGLANVELNLPATKDTAYNIASIGKQLTAAAIMLLVENGRIGLDDRITNYLSDLPPAWSEVTIRQLLSHTSGIKDYTKLPDFAKLSKSPVTTRQLINLLAGYPLEFHPGAKWSYCNTGYHLLGEAVARTSGRPYADFLQERIFAPLGMNSTRFYDSRAVITNRASPYDWENGALRNADYLDYSWVFGAGGEAATVVDMARWDAGLHTEKLLSRRRWEQMWTPVTLNDGSTFAYGFGWHVQNDEYVRRVIWHGGRDPGFLSAMFHWLDDRVTVIVLLTGGSSFLPNGQESSADIALGLSRRYIPRLFLKPIADTAPTQTQEMRAVFESLRAGTLDHSLISTNLNGKRLSDTEQWAARLSDLGVIKSFVPDWKCETNNVRDLGYRAVFRKESVNFSVSLGADNKISRLQLEIE